MGASSSDGYFIVYAEGKSWLVEKVSPSDVIEEMYNIAVKMGANAVIKFTADIIYSQNGVLSVPGYQVTGFAIKRK
ncbi:MAG: hypothetical protein NTZ27_11020 [Ignavibacteriales bacterium]|nr:hypothetical protein [Ignavibacteriales bacterium]